MKQLTPAERDTIYHRLKAANAPTTRADRLKIAADTVRMFDGFQPTE